MRKAFIAAPLIGTIIFVTAIVFVVNINKSEGNAITQISQEAYHNRINSIVELYRADAGSLFREDVKKVVEQALTSQCWNLFEMEVYNDPRNPSAREENLRRARFESCVGIRDTIQSVICANTGDASANECTNQCSGETDTASCLRRCGGATRTYGLQNWFNNINQEFEFEGMVLSPSNTENFQSFFNPRMADGSSDLRMYIDNCRSLMRELTMDCGAFAGTSANPTPVLQCCDTATGFDETCPSDKIIPGCGDGIFYVKVFPSEQGIFENLPRIQAKDEAGNYLKAGALADADEILLPISFPLLKYLDVGYNAYSGLAYGRTIGSDDGNAEGVLDGVCNAPASVCSALDPSMPSSSDLGNTDFNAAERSAADNFYQNTFLPAFENLPEEFEIAVLTTSEEVAGTCKKEGGFTCDEGAENGVKSSLLSAISYYSQPSGASTINYPYFANRLNLKFKIIDKNPSFKVKQDADNEFCTTAKLSYNNPPG